MNHHPWTTLPEAAAILLDCAASPPRMVRKATGTGFKFDPSDLRMVVLEAIRDRFFREVIQPRHSELCANPPADLADRILARNALVDAFITVDEAIDAVPEAAVAELAKALAA